MGASSRHKDLFVELGAMKAKPGTAYGSIGAPLNADTAQIVDGAGHNHLPTPAVLKLVGDSFKNAPVTNPDGIYGDPRAFRCRDRRITPSTRLTRARTPTNISSPRLRREAASRSSETACVPSATQTCQFPAFPGTVSWKIGFQLYRDAPVAAADGAELTPAEEDACEASKAAGTGSCRQRFDSNRKDFFHYVLYAHARGIPEIDGPRIAGLPRPARQLRHRRPARRRRPRVAGLLGFDSSVRSSSRRQRRCTSSATTWGGATAAIPPNPIASPIT